MTFVDRGERIGVAPRCRVVRTPPLTFGWAATGYRPSASVVMTAS
jgi:hypothetical protein